MIPKAAEAAIMIDTPMLTKWNRDRIIVLRVIPGKTKHANRYRNIEYENRGERGRDRQRDRENTREF